MLRSSKLDHDAGLEPSGLRRHWKTGCESYDLCGTRAGVLDPLGLGRASDLISSSGTPLVGDSVCRMAHWRSRASASKRLGRTVHVGGTDEHLCLGSTRGVGHGRILEMDGRLVFERLPH